MVDSVGPTQTNEKNRASPIGIGVVVGNPPFQNAIVHALVSAPPSAPGRPPSQPMHDCEFEKELGPREPVPVIVRHFEPRLSGRHKLWKHIMLA